MSEFSDIDSINTLSKDKLDRKENASQSSSRDEIEFETQKESKQILKRKMLNLEEDLTKLLEKMLLEDNEAVSEKDEKEKYCKENRFERQLRKCTSEVGEIKEKVIVGKKCKTSGNYFKDFGKSSSSLGKMSTSSTIPVLPQVFSNNKPYFMQNLVSSSNSNVTPTSGSNPTSIDTIPGDEINSLPKFISFEFYLSLKGKFSYLIQNYNGSLLLQNSLNNTDPRILCLIFNEIENEIPNLICHQYGNYFCQRFYSLLNIQEKVRFLSKIVGKHLLIISANPVGNYPLQSIIEVANSLVEEKIIIDSFRDQSLIEFMATDANASHVLEKILSRFSEDSISFLYKYVLDNFLNLAVNQHGLSLVKKVIIHSQNFVTKKKIQIILIENFTFLVQNVYGNYSIQIAIEYWDHFLVMPIVKLFLNKFAKFSILKYSSNVVEKCLERGGEGMVNIFIEEIISNCKLILLLKNNYGNYVLQKALNLALPTSKIFLINNILQELRDVEDKKIIVKWKHICDSNMSLLMTFNNSSDYFQNGMQMNINNINTNINQNMSLNMFDTRLQSQFNQNYYPPQNDFNIQFY